MLTSLRSALCASFTLIICSSSSFAQQIDSGVILGRTITSQAGTSVDVRVPSIDNTGFGRLGPPSVRTPENADARTVSVMTLQAPKNARRSYENAQQAFAKTELDKAERELKKATNVYPRFALAWTLLGRVHDKEARLDEAKEDYLRALSADSRLIRPYRRLAEIAFESKNWQEVVQLTNQLITIHPSDAPVAYLYNAAANFNMGNFDAAELNGRRFESLDAKHMRPQAYLLLGDILQHKGKYREAAQQMKMFLAIVPQDPFAEPIAKEVDRLLSLGDVTDGRNSQTH